MRRLRKDFLTGLVLCLPVAITIYVVRFLVDLAAAPAKSLVVEVCKQLLHLPERVVDDFWIRQAVVLISALFVVFAVTVIGFFSRYFMGRFLIDTLEHLIARVPMIKSVYTSIKQIVTTFSAQNKANFKQVVLVQFPHSGAWTVAFVTNREPSELSEKLGHAVVHVFVPTTPNPTGGYFLLLRESEVKPLKMSVADGMKLIVSGGAVLPGAAKEEPVEAAGAGE
ncbi:MAG: DUF502 domain-containing protein [Puniceicoccales bacterium]|nr:DUF502 domain-containing protein [Puniceicoccales bacterium]